MTAREHRLFQFFAGYFNQDWDVDGAKSWRDVVTWYVNTNRRSDALLVLDDLRSWLEETAAGPNPTQGLPAEFGCDYDPRAHGSGEREWVRDLAEYLSERLHG